MVSAKIFVLLFAFAACQAAPQPEPRDFSVIITNAIKIARIIGDAVAKGIDDATPAIQAIEGEMDPSLAAKVKGLLERIRDKVVASIVANTKALEAQLQTSIANIQAAAGACTDKAETDLKPILNAYGKYLAELITAIGADNREDLDSLYASMSDLGNRQHKLNMDSVIGGEKCVTGKKDVKACLDANGESFTTGIAAMLADGVLLGNEAISVFNTTLTALTGGLQPGMNNTRDQADAVMAAYGTCVQNS